MAQTTIVSGAGGALGSVITQHFLQNKFRVEAIYQHHPSASPDIVNKSLNQHVVDLLDENLVNQTVDSIISDNHHVDILVCTAGGFRASNIENTGADELQKQYQMNFLTAYNLTRPVYLHMKKQGKGRIFLIGSRQGLHAAQASHAVAYGLSKSLLFHLAEILNNDSDGRVVTSMIVPSTIDTPANRAAMPGADYSKWVSPEKIAEIIRFYSSESAAPVRNPVIQVFGDS